MIVVLIIYSRFTTNRVSSQMIVLFCQKDPIYYFVAPLWIYQIFNPNFLVDKVIYFVHKTKLLLQKKKFNKSIAFNRQISFGS